VEEEEVEVQEYEEPKMSWKEMRQLISMVLTQPLARMVSVKCVSPGASDDSGEAVQHPTRLTVSYVWGGCRAWARWRVTSQRST